MKATHENLWYVDKVAISKIFSFFALHIAIIIIIILQYWGLNSGPASWTTPPALFFVKGFWGKFSQTICPGRLQTKTFEEEKLSNFANWLTVLI
jgi:hypothetical protein